MSALLVIGMALSGVATVFVCVGVHRGYAWLQGRTARPALPGAAGGGSGGSSYVHDENGHWFDQNRPAHPDRPDEDYPDVPNPTEGFDH